MSPVGRYVVAVNTAPTSENRMHGAEARHYGFSSGLVPGVDVLAYLAHEGVVRWGAEWLAGGRLAGRLDAPVYDGERVAVVTKPDPSEDPSAPGLETRVVGPGGETRARATLSPRPATFDQGEGVDIPMAARPNPAERPVASRARLEPGTVLGTQGAAFRASKAHTYLDEVSETHPAFRRDGLAHPGWMLRFANWALSGTVRLGPWIHVSSDLSLLAPVRDGDQLEVRAVVTDRFERKGHEFVDLRALFKVAGDPVALVDHRAIWQPRLAS